MARGRVALTDKEEKILLQAQLMGLGTASMVKISNRLKALEKERDDRIDVAEAVGQKTWEKTTKGWNIKTEEGFLFEYVKIKAERLWSTYTVIWDLRLTKPGTRFKVRHFKNKKSYAQNDWRAKDCPAGSKDLYSLIRYTNGFIRDLKWELESIE